MGNAADTLIDRIAASLPLDSTCITDLPEAASVDSFDPAVHAKAWWCYGVAARASGAPLIDEQTFLKGYFRAFCDFYLAAAQAREGDGSPLERGLPPIVCTAHFPSYPLYMRAFRERGACVLISRRATWMGDGWLQSVHEKGALSAVTQAVQKGRSIVAMIDHAFPTTSNAPIPFLGLPCATPMGLFALASRMSLGMGLLVPGNNSEPEVVDYPATANMVPGTLAAAMLRDLSRVIMKTPERWLLWPNLNHRWEQDADLFDLD
ncbi:MAG: hypothetical protein QNJ97_05765 [Myxococcota bacterium]|nr:hypothetical protein [Myxococcota bacterium]